MLDTLTVVSKGFSSKHLSESNEIDMLNSTPLLKLLHRLVCGQSHT